VVKEPERLSALEREEGMKILLCHKPEEYWKHMRARDFDLVIAGHAHGGQIRLGNQGVYAPGQGLLPRLTRGKYDEKLIVSAGAGNPAGMPRWGNPCEILLIQLD
jgi:predicted MPP superfamily phosphohydrolase